MVMPQYRYACAKCAYGWHDTPYCPGDVGKLAYSTMSMMDAEYEIRRLEKQARQRRGEPEPVLSPWRFRWWWIPLGITVYIVLLILI
ncbi:hypothetical protein [Nocardia bovistercoris]|uniref:Uncharacterized protein n=1 Tax=Nocardia bovistercoris TaxID=2785916 RepID=A0A931IIR8_9NOCA|nr:hypothetical protein [Nocardia bovistercoris]MBH0780363.1 hypothetical protein [Nocardia bovistercoris]